VLASWPHCAPSENVRAELTLLFDMIEELDCAAITHTLKPIAHGSR
jgi:hypothetical protein